MTGSVSQWYLIVPVGENFLQEYCSTPVSCHSQ